ncbi:ADP-ribosyltransferase [Prosthecodimorpha staleyi]|uniref:ADP-ribosyltransferase n=1 Tax=Prosthecodimorpha staleyi TaxID=2840188 RepID=A0A947D043_9HYPH|nr:ADP-ribosyltransferase [Prosthecodimorpha staleyi]MBT9288295.1 ADP-ribosyltransferase [Prosthecodimorpha staleyi]
MTHLNVNAPKGTHANFGVDAQQNQPEVKGNAFTRFFSALFGRIRDTFASLGQKTATQPKHDNGGAEVSFSPTTSKKEINQAKKDFRASEMYQAVMNGDSGIKKENLETGMKTILSRPECVSLMKEHGLTLGEAVGIFMYTTGDYTPINNQLRSGEMTDDVRALNKEIVSGMAKLPSYEGPSLTRLTDLPKHIADDYQAGNTVEPGGYSSTSTITTGAMDFLGGEFLMRIAVKEGSGGKDVQAFSNKQDENEILFPPGTKFKVLKRAEPEPDPYAIMGMPTKLESKKTTLTLQEV